MGSTLTEAAFLAPEAAAPGIGAEPAVPAGRCADPLRRLIGRIDDGLRWWYGVRGLSDRDDCLLRIALAQTAETTRLADGSALPSGALVIDLHLWNERLCLLPPLRHGFGRAAALRRHLRSSLEELARLCERGGLPEHVTAIRAQTALVPKRRIGKLLRVAAAFGLAPAAPAAQRRPERLRVGRFWQDLFVAALAWSFNPAALRRNGWRRQPCVLWMSRAALLSTYGDAVRRERDGETPFAGETHHRTRSSASGAPRPGAYPGLAAAGRPAIRKGGFPDRGGSIA